MHFPLKRAVTSVLAMGEVYILQSYCGMTVPRPMHARIAGWEGTAAMGIHAPY